MNTNDAKEYLARREIPQLFEVRHGDMTARPLLTLTSLCLLILFNNVVSCMHDARQGQTVINKEAYISSLKVFK